MAVMPYEAMELLPVGSGKYSAPKPHPRMQVTTNLGSVIPMGGMNRTPTG